MIRSIDSSALRANAMASFSPVPNLEKVSIRVQEYGRHQAVDLPALPGALEIFLILSRLNTEPFLVMDDLFPVALVVEDEV